MSPCAYGRYIEYMNVQSKKVIVEVRVLEKSIVINDKDVRTNKWLLPQYWQEVYDILHSAAANHIKNKYDNGITTHGENLSVSLDFIPYMPAYMYILKPYACNSNILEESFIDSGSAWLEESPYEWMVVAIVSPRYSSDYPRSSNVSSKIGRGAVATALSNSANECSPSFTCFSDSEDKYFLRKSKFSDSECKLIERSPKKELYSPRTLRSQHLSIKNRVLDSLFEIKEGSAKITKTLFPKSQIQNEYTLQKTKFLDSNCERKSDLTSIEVDSSDEGPPTQNSDSERVNSSSKKFSMPVVVPESDSDNSLPDFDFHSEGLDCFEEHSKYSSLPEHVSDPNLSGGCNEDGDLETDSQVDFMDRHTRSLRSKSRSLSQSSADSVKPSMNKTKKLRKNKQEVSDKRNYNMIADNASHSEFEVKKSKVTNTNFQKRQNNEQMKAETKFDNDLVGKWKKCKGSKPNKKGRDEVLSSPIEESQDENFKSKKKLIKMSDSDKKKASNEPKKSRKGSIKDYFNPENILHEEVELLASDYHIESFNSSTESTIQVSPVHIKESQGDFKSKKKVIKGKESNKNKETSEPTKKLKSTIKEYFNPENEEEPQMSSSNYVESANSRGKKSTSRSSVHVRESCSTKLKDTLSSTHPDNSSVIKTKPNKLSRSLETKTKNKLHIKNEPCNEIDDSNVSMIEKPSKMSRSKRIKVEKMDSKNVSKKTSSRQKSVFPKVDISENGVSNSGHGSSSSEEIISHTIKCDKKKSKSLKKSLEENNLDADDDTAYKLSHDGNKTTSPEKNFAKQDIPKLRNRKNNKEIKDLFGSSDEEVISSSKKVLAKEQRKENALQTPGSTPDDETTSSTLMEREKYKVSDLSDLELKKYFEKHAYYLHDLISGKGTCERQELFKKGGSVSRELRFATSTVPFRNEQLFSLLTLIRKKFFHKLSFVTYYDYVMKVMLPEMTTRIFMDRFSMTHDEAIDKINTIYFLAPEPIDFDFDLEDFITPDQGRDDL